MTGARGGSLSIGHGAVPPAEALGGHALGAGVLLGASCWEAGLQGQTGAGEDGAPGGIRTPDQWLRKPLLYPAELRARWSDIVDEIHCVCATCGYAMTALSSQPILLGLTGCLPAVGHIQVPDRT